MSRTTAMLLVALLWAAIYLPGLGSTELRGEEGRRILPAVTMIESGNWLVPYIGGKPYLRKPPLMNWLIASSFKVAGVQNEWTARLPSAVAVLALGLTIAASGFLNPPTGLSAALMAMTTFGLLAKARFAGGEIEGVYVPLFGIALVTWLDAWLRRLPGWRLWLLPAIFLGLGALAKGPLHVFFFYGIAGSVLWRANHLRELYSSGWHFVGVLALCGIVAAWAVPYLKTEAASKASKVWKDQMTTRVTENRFNWASYASNIPRGAGDLMPWALLGWGVYRMGKGGRLLPATADDSGDRVIELATEKTRSEPRNESVEECPSGQAQILGAVLWSSLAMFFALLLIPGVLPRYVLPLAIPIILVLAVAIRQTRIAAWPLRGSVVMAIFSILYAVFAIPHINRRDDLRPLAAQIGAAVPSGGKLTLYDPGYQAWIFYLRCRYEYAPVLEDIPERPDAVVARGKEGRKFAEKRPDLAVRHTFHDKNGATFLLLVPR